MALQAKVKSVKLGNVTVKVVIEVRNLELVSVITRELAERMGLVAGTEGKAVVKSMVVLVATDQP